jgi:hypothetical protein
MTRRRRALLAQLALATGGLLVTGLVSAPSGSAAASCLGKTVTITAKGGTVNGTAGDDVISGSSKAEKIHGGAGNDTICAGPGKDVVTGDEGEDTVDGGDGQDRLSGDAGNDVLIGRDGADHLDGGDGADQLDGREGDDRLFGGADNDVLEGRDGDDRIDGGAGDDVARGWDGDDRLEGGEGNDELSGGAANDNLEGGPGRDILDGGNDADRLRGGDGDDDLRGERGDDDLDGGAQIDKCDGGPGKNKVTGCEEAHQVVVYQDGQFEVTWSDLSPGDRLPQEIRNRFGNLRDAYLAQFKIRNLSARPVPGWGLMFELPDEITGVAPGELASQGEGQVVIRHDAPTRVIEPGRDVTSWYAARRGVGDVPKPQWVTVLNGGVLPTADSDRDDLPDFLEQRAGLDPHKDDTDGDGLPDSVEWEIRTDPTKRDTDGNGTEDAHEDPDGDSVVNLDEVRLNTNPRGADTDADALDDGGERSRRTDPRKPDSDGDGVEDGEEARIGSDPLVAESSFDVTRSVTGGASSPSVTIEGMTAAQVATFTIAELPTDHAQFPSGMPGYVDNGYEFAVDGEFDEAEVAFRFDESLAKPDFKPAIYTFDEDAQRLVKLDDQQIVGNTVTARTTHFSKYILLNSIEFDNAWTYAFLEAPDPNTVFDRLDLAFVIDSSGSMGTNDPNRERVQVAKNFVQRLSDDDRAAVIDFDSGAVVRSPLTSDKTALESALDGIDAVGGTNLTAGIATGLQVLGDPRAGERVLRTIIMLTDGEGAYDAALTQQAKDRGIVIHTVGLGPSVSAGLLSSIANGTGGKYYAAADAEQLSDIFDDLSEASDLLKDSDGDGINDYYEKEMHAGHLLLGNGVPLGLMDHQNPDSDGDGLRDGHEVSIKKLPLVPKVVYAYLTSHPLKTDTDGDQIPDNTDPRPLVFERGDIVIHQSANREGRLKEPDRRHFQVPPSWQVSDDLTFNDYTTGELRDLGGAFWVAPITPEPLIWAEFGSILWYGKNGADADHRAVVDGLRDTFRNGHGGRASSPVSKYDLYDSSKYIQYSTPELNRAVRSSPQMQRYINKAKPFIIQSIVNNRGGVGQLQVQPDLNKNYLYRAFDNAGLQYPVYDKSNGANEKALAIAIHQFHGHQIRLKDYRVTGNTFSGKLVFHSYDHFGLDPDDGVTRIGFVDWFTLQHYDRFDGKYVPPLAVVDIEVPINGSF